MAQAAAPQPTAAAPKRQVPWLLLGALLGLVAMGGLVVVLSRPPPQAATLPLPAVATTPSVAVATKGPSGLAQTSRRQVAPLFPKPDLSRLRQNSPERAAGGFLSSWMANDFGAMAKAAAPSWKLGKSDQEAVQAIERLYGARKLVGADITVPPSSRPELAEIPSTLWTAATDGTFEERRLSVAMVPELADGTLAVGSAPAQWALNPESLAARIAEAPVRMVTPVAGATDLAEAGGSAAATPAAGVAAGASQASDAMRAAMAAAARVAIPAAADAQPRYGSGGLGLSQEAWQTAAGRNIGGTGISSQGWYVISTRGGNIDSIERNFEAASGTTLEVARAHARGLMPEDARPVRTAQPTPGRTVDVFISESLRGRFTGETVWGGAPPGTFAATYAAAEGRILSLRLAVGPGT